MEYPRYNQAKESGIEIHDVIGTKISQGDVRGILRDGTGEGMAEVGFVGVDGSNYRATWRVRRARGKADGKIQAYETELFNSSMNLPFPGNKTEILPEIQRLVGLTFEQFTRSILLAQGDFTAFLKANKDEKSSLLEKLTGTHIYSDISTRIFERFRKEEQELRDLNLRREGIQVLSGEEIGVLELEKAALEDPMARMDNSVRELNREAQWHQQHSILVLGVSEAKSTLEQAEAKKNAVSEREHTLSRIDQVQEARVTANALTDARSVEMKLKEGIDKLNTDIDKISLQQVSASTLFDEAETSLQKSTKEKQEALPLLAEARRLDIVLEEREKQILNLTKQVEGSKKKHDDFAILLDTKRKVKLELALDIESLVSWISQNQDRQPIAENYKLIISKLNDEQQVLEKVASISSEISSGKMQITEATAKITELDKQISEKNEKLTQQKADIEAEETALADFNINQTIEEKESIDTNMVEAKESHGHWRLLYSNMADYGEIENRLSKDRDAIIVKEELLKQTTEQVLILSVKKETSLKLFEKARLEAAGDVKSLRAQLQPGNACPVCGSEHHPYADHSPEVDAILNSIKAEHDENEKAYHEHLSIQIGLKESIATLATSITDQSLLAGTKEASVRQLKETWASYSASKESSNIPANEVGQWFDERIDSLTVNQKALHSKIQAYNSRRDGLEIKKTVVTDLESVIKVAENNKKDFERTIRSSTELTERAIAQNREALSQISAIESEIGRYFTGGGWVIQYKANPETFIQQLISFSVTWESNHKTLDAKQQSKELLGREISGVESQLENSVEELGVQEGRLSELEVVLNGLKIDRSEILGGEQANVIEVRHDSAIATFTNSVKEQRSKVDELTINIAKLTTQRSDADTQLTQAAQKIERLSEEFAKWLDNFNRRNSVEMVWGDILKLLEFSHEWMDSERNALQAVADGLMRSVSILKERENALQNHASGRLSDRSLEAINEAITTVSAQLSSSRTRSNEISFILRDNAQNNQRIGELLTQITAKSELFNNWSKLNEIIGSADGKKFRQIAQEYTLDVLLGYANVHLQSLSSRYAIQRISESLGLQVVDFEMGNEIRTVFTLSGGESFLVSLALALGLASLSLNRMRVESLFIDEGFGSLDPNTLSIAMDALERLHNQGRKVGVISHVQEMTERIPVQIRVKKLSSGRGKVEVVNTML